MNGQMSSRYLVKLSKDTMVANSMDGVELDRFPIWLVVNNQNRTTGCFVWGIKGRDFATTADGHTPFSMSLFTADDLDVQLEKDGEFVNFAAALESGAARWNDWEEEYLRIGLVEKAPVDRGTYEEMPS